MEKTKNKYWIHIAELKLHYQHALKEGEFKGTFEEYRDDFLKRMEDINLPHTIIVTKCPE